MSVRVSSSVDANDQKALSLLNDCEQAILSLRGDSFDGQSSNSALADFQRLMDDHAERVSVLEQYRLMVQRRRETCAEAMKKHKESEEEVQEQKEEMDEGKGLSRQRSVSMRDCTSSCGILSGKQSVSATIILSGTTSEKASTIASLRPEVTSINSSRANGRRKSNTAKGATLALSCNPNSSYKWTRPRNALAGSTVSFVAKQRPRRDVVPPAAPQREQQTNWQAQSGCEGVNGKWSTSEALHNTSRLSSQQSQRRGCLQHQRPTDASVSVSPSLLPCRSRRASFTLSEISAERSTVSHAQGVLPVVSGDACCGKEDGGNDFAVAQPDASVCSSTKKPCVPVVATKKTQLQLPQCNEEISMLEIETEEDKLLHTCPAPRDVPCPLLPHSEKAFGDVSAGATEANFLSPKKQQQKKEEPSAIFSVGSPTYGKYEEPSFMTTVTAHTTDISPLLERFGRHVDEATSKSGRDTKPVTFSLSSNENRVFDDLSYRVKDCSPSHYGGSAASGNITRSVGHSTHTFGEKYTKPVFQSGSVSSTREIDGEEKAASLAAAAAILQGVIFQSRRLLPCYYCGELQSFSVYRLHLDLCQARTDALYTRHGLNVMQLSMCVPKQSIPGAMASKKELDAFVHACYQSVKKSILPCSKCGVLSRIHDLSDHKRVCIKGK